MRCPGCSADVSVLREFCPVCGMSVDAGLRGGLQRSRDERPAGDRKVLRKVAVIGAALLGLGVVTQVEWPWSDSDSGGQVWAPGPVTIEADELQKAYADDPGAAEERFGGREMVVSGEFLRIVPDGYGSLDLRLKTSDPDKQLGIDVAQLAIEDAPVFHRQVDAGFVAVAGHLAQAACAGLQDEVVAAVQFAGQGAGEQAGTVPALGALVDQQDDAVRRAGIVEAVESVDLFLRRFTSIAQHAVEGLAEFEQGASHDGTQLA